MTDISIFNLIHGLAGHWSMVDALMIFFAEYLQYLMGAAVLIYLFLGKGAERRRNQLMVFAAVLAAAISRGIITEIIRFFYYRPRPFLAEHFIPLISHDAEGSFPSGHMTFFWAVSAAVYFYNKKLGTVLAIASLIMGIARIYVGVHWPSDILGGAAIGIASGWLVSWYIENRWKK